MRAFYMLPRNLKSRLSVMISNGESKNIDTYGND